MEKNNLFKKIKSLDSHLNEFKEVSKVENPKEGWINKIRTSLNITSKRLGENFRKPISAQAIIEFEKSEMKGNISLESMKKFAEALNLEFVYGFAPKKDTFEMRIKTEFKHKIEEHRKFVPIDDLNYDKGTQLKAVMENEYQREIDSLPKSFWNSKLTYNNMMNRYTFSPISEKDGIGEMKIDIRSSASQRIGCTVCLSRRFVLYLPSFVARRKSGNASELCFIERRSETRVYTHLPKSPNHTYCNGELRQRVIVYWFNSDWSLVYIMKKPRIFFGAFCFR